MKPETSSPPRPRLRRAGIAAAVVLGHLVLVLAIVASLPRARGLPVYPAIQVLLVAPPPSIDRKTSRSGGGGAPAAPSRIHVPPPVRPVPPELPAPPQPAPMPEPPVGVAAAPTSIPSHAIGQDGQGTGGGSGAGEGDGPGSGSMRERFVRGPSQADLRRVFPPQALAARRGGQARLRCHIGLDTRLEACVVVDESPPGLGFGRAAMEAAAAFRFQPPIEHGRAVAGREVTVGVKFDAPPRRGLF